jgi:hypothetical protein
MPPTPTQLVAISVSAASSARFGLVSLLAVPLALLLEQEEEGLASAALRALAALGFPREIHAVLGLMAPQPRLLIDWWEAHEGLLSHLAAGIPEGGSRGELKSARGDDVAALPPTEAGLAALAAQGGGVASRPPHGLLAWAAAGGAAAAALSLRVSAAGAWGNDGEAGAPEVCALPPARRTVVIEARELWTFSWNQVRGR